ncbi:hypothetical protein [Streptomyces clavuligerus]|uniref:hypothetical protein n=1 Tax=Streptomyces clavuligerus TaxID=1901 RepID=UPI00020D90FE|nr:hypothetical protein [Streptomyces clavuligerus]WDN57548.1 hypothetical protein LL058_37985 [Streptomyces clavuligerus]
MIIAATAAGADDEDDGTGRPSIGDGASRVITAVGEATSRAHPADCPSRVTFS